MYGTAGCWITGGPLPGLHTVADVFRATSSLTIASAILPVVTRLYAELQADRPDRFIVGLGGAHGPKPIATMESYLDQLDAVPRESRVLAALGPRMLRMARDRSAGALPVLITPEYTAQARALLGAGPLLAVEQQVVLESDPDRAREIAAGPISFLRQLPGTPRASAGWASPTTRSRPWRPGCSTRWSPGVTWTRSQPGWRSTARPAPTTSR